MSGRMVKDCTEVPGEIKDIKVFVVVIEKEFAGGTKTRRVDYVFLREWQAEKRARWIEAHEKFTHTRVIERFVHGLI